MSTPRLGEPIAVWDAHAPGWPSLRKEGACDWAYANVPEVDRTFRIEFHLIDVPFAVVHRYDESAGRREVDPDTGEPAVDEPVVVALSCLPPEHLLKQPA